MITFGEDYVSYPDGQQNVGQPPDSIMSGGFIPETAAARGQPLPAQWLTWLFQKLFRLANRDRVTSATGVGLFAIPNSFIRVEAFDRDNSNNYLVAIGYKAAANVTHTLKVVSSSGLTLGVGTASGNQPIIGGGANVVVLGMSRQTGDI